MIILILAVAVAVVILACMCFWIRSAHVDKSEKFSQEIIAAKPSREFLQYFDMGDHGTTVRIQKGSNDNIVFLLHNSPWNIQVWEPLYQTMQRMTMDGIKTPTLVCYDLRGHGTAWVPVDKRYNDANFNNHAWSLDLYMQDCKRVYDAIIGGAKVTIVGFGLGGIIAQRFALSFPNLVSHLVLLQTSITPMPGLSDEINYLADWIDKNPNITYLTSEESYVRQALCNDWFYLPNTQCQGVPNHQETSEKYRLENKTPQYNLGEAMWREASAITTLQGDKLLVATNLIPEWENVSGKIDFDVHILAATEDPLAPPSKMTQTYTTIYNNNRQVMVILDIVTGKHAFSLMNPDYIAGIICKDCKAISTIVTQEGRVLDAF